MVPSFNCKFGERSFLVVAPKIYNRLPTTITSAESLESFKAFLKTFYFKLSQHELVFDTRMTRLNTAENKFILIVVSLNFNL